LLLEAVKDNIEASRQNALVVSGASHGVSLAGVGHSVRKQQTCAASTLPSQPSTPQTHTHSSVVFFTATDSSMLLNGALQRKVVGQIQRWSTQPISWQVQHTQPSQPITWLILTKLNIQ